MDNMLQNNPSPVRDGKPYFLGQHALIRFSGGEEGFGPDVYWLVDKEDHTIRPFESNMALDAAFGEDLQEALSKAVTVSSPQIDSNGDIVEGILADFSILGPEYAIKEDGTSEPVSFSSHQLKGRYGKPINEDEETSAERTVDSLLSKLSQNESGSDMTARFINGLKKDNQLMAFYIAAVAYGGYDENDIHADILRRFKQSKK
jgi:hypothetical protein